MGDDIGGLSVVIIYQSKTITIHKFKCGPYDNNAYLLVCPQSSESIVIDTPAEPYELISAASKTNVKAIVITHNHSDHLLGFNEVTSVINAPVGIGEADAHALPKSANFYLVDSSSVDAGSISAKFISTPGHTPGSTCLSIGSHLFTGDTLFPGGPGRTRSPELFRQEIKSIIDRLFILPESTLVLPGHGSDVTIAEAKKEYRVFASKAHEDDLHGDVTWLED